MAEAADHDQVGVEVGGGAAQQLALLLALARQPVHCGVDAVPRQIGRQVGAGLGPVALERRHRVDQHGIDPLGPLHQPDGVAHRLRRLDAGVPGDHHPLRRGERRRPRRQDQHRTT